MIADKLVRFSGFLEESGAGRWEQIIMEGRPRYLLKWHCNICDKGAALDLMKNFNDLWRHYFDNHEEVTACYVISE